MYLQLISGNSTSIYNLVIRDHLQLGEIRESPGQSNSLPIWDLSRLVAERWTSATPRDQLKTANRVGRFLQEG